MKRNWIGNFFAVSCAAISLVFCASSHAQSQPPAVSFRVSGEPQKQESEASKKAAGEYHGDAPASPLLLKTETAKNLPNSNAYQSEGTTADWRMVWLTLGLLIVAALQGGFFIHQWVLMKRTIVDTKRSNERQLRAYVVRMQERPKLPGINYSLSFRIGNCGQTPAYDLKFKFGWVCLEGSGVPWPKPSAYDYNGQASNPVSALAAGDETTITSTFSGSFNGKRIEEYIPATGGESKVTLYAFGAIEYMDTFKIPRVTEYCLRLIASPINDIECEHHNDHT